MAKAVGVDVVEIARMIEKIQKHDVKFLERFCTAREIESVHRDVTLSDGDIEKSWKFSSIAGIYAAKEAFAKAIGTGVAKGVNLKDIEILNDQSGAPYYQLYGSTYIQFKEAGFANPLLSISHDAGIATAVCILN